MWKTIACKIRKVIPVTQFLVETKKKCGLLLASYLEYAATSGEGASQLQKFCLLRNFMRGIKEANSMREN